MSGKPLKRTKTFLMKKSPPPPQQPTTYIPKKTQTPPDPIEFPTSPQLSVRAEILHFGHPQHPLSEINLPDLFTCVGCKEYGAGKRFNCPQCDFRLHDFCALAPPLPNAHPFHSHHQLQFHSKPVKGGILQSKCDICHKPAKGYNFQCSACNFQMHPCCAMLSVEINVPAHLHPLRLLPTTTLSNRDAAASFVCGECKRKRSGRVYHCSVCDYHLHAVCAKNMVNGLYVNGIKGKEKPGMFGNAAKIASQVVVEFIGGLMEGLGEGFGQALIQGVSRGGRSRRPISQ